MVDAWDGDPARLLAKRLKALRMQEWPDVTITQRQLAEGLSRTKPVSVPLISSWESMTRPVVPPMERLVAYATFFASRRSVEREPFRVLDAEQLTEAERKRRDELIRELLDARAVATRGRTRPRRHNCIAEPLGGPWRFNDTHSVTIVCPAVPPDQHASLPRPEDPDRAYAELYAVADLDAVFELHGHLRAANPTSIVRVRVSSQLQPEDYTGHLVVLGGVDWNAATRSLLRMTESPVQQVSTGRLDEAYFAVKDGEDCRRFRADLAEGGSLVNDVGHFFRAPNPFNLRRTLTVCNAMYSRGVLGAARMLTDELFRERNTNYLAARFHGHDSYSLLVRVSVVDSTVVTPDLTRSDVRLHEWPGGAARGEGASIRP